MLRIYAYLSLTLAWVLLTTADAATIHVNSIAGLQSAIDSAVPGDNIIVADGVYTTIAQITVSRVGTSAQPIVIQAATIGAVEIAGTHGFAFNSPAAYVHVQGFKLTHASGRNSINSGATFCRFTRNIFQCTGDGAYLTVAGYDAQVDRNEFRDKSTVGNMIDVRGSGSQIARRVWIHHNYFHDFTNAGANGAETIRFGLSGLSMSTGDGMIEYNLFVRCCGENELISNKSSGNIYRYNTFLESAGAQLTLRHGNDCLAYGNYFKGTDGLRVYGDRHQIFSNYFEANTKGIDMGNGDGEVADGSPLTCHDRPDDCVVTFNTFINNNVHYQMGGRTGGLGATNITVANNIMQGGGSMASISSTAPYTGTWSGNIGWNTGGPGNMPASGYTTVNPLLAADGSGIYHIQAGSPAIGTAVGTYPAVTVDMDGQPRDAAKDKGADEFSTAPVTAHLLTAAEVGPFSDIFPIDPATPADRELIVGSDMVFEVIPVEGMTILSYQWFEVTLSGDISIGADSPVLTILNARKSDGGRRFYCRVTTDAGTFNSRTAQITSLQTSLVAHLNFEGAANDISGKENHGTLLNGASIISDLERGSVLFLDGVDDYVDLGNDASLDLGGIGRVTIAAWVKPAVTKNHNSILTKGEWKEAYSLVIKGDSTPQNLLWTGNDTSIFSGAAIPVGVWTHAAVVIDGSLATFYVNGQTSGPLNQNRGGPIDNTSTAVCIGREQYSGSLPAGRWLFNGYLDDVRIYGRALTQSELQGVMNPPIEGDINEDGQVTLADFAFISSQWLTDGSVVPSADIAPVPLGDSLVDMQDLALMASHFLQII